MKWGRQRRNPPQRDPRAMEARRDAERDLANRIADARRVQSMTQQWRQIRERNHFAIAIEHSFRGGHT